MKKIKIGGMRIKTLSNEEILSRDNAIQKSQNEALEIIEAIENADLFSNTETVNMEMVALLTSIKEKAERIDEKLDFVISKFL